MADNYLENRYEEYLKRKAAADKKHKIAMQKIKDRLMAQQKEKERRLKEDTGE